MKPLFVSGAYFNDPTKGSGLDAFVHDWWKSRYDIELATTVYDRDTEIEAYVKANGNTQVLVGHSHGGAKCVKVAIAHPEINFYLVLIDPVPFPNPKPNYIGFDLPFNVPQAWCVYRKSLADGKTPITTCFSGPIRTGQVFSNLVYVPNKKLLAGTNKEDEPAEHGQYVLDSAAVTASVVKKFMGLANPVVIPAPPVVVPAPDQPPVVSVPLTLEQRMTDFESRLLVVEAALKAKQV